MPTNVFLLDIFFFFLRKLKNVSCEYDLFEWLKPYFASCVVHQTRSYNMFFVNKTYDMIINNSVLHKISSARVLFDP